MTTEKKSKNVIDVNILGINSPLPFCFHPTIPLETTVHKKYHLFLPHALPKPLTLVSVA